MKATKLLRLIATDECLEIPPHVSKIQFEKYSLGNPEKSTDDIETIFNNLYNLEEAEIYEILNNNNKTITIKEEIIKGFPPEIILDFSEKDLIYLQRMDDYDPQFHLGKKYHSLAYFKDKVILEVSTFHYLLRSLEQEIIYFGFVPKTKTKIPTESLLDIYFIFE
jgi:hypothetical protein